MFIILWLNDLIRWPYRYLLRTATWLLNMIESLFEICSSWQWMRIEVWNPIKVLCGSLKCNRKNTVTVYLIWIWLIQELYYFHLIEKVQCYWIIELIPGSRRSGALLFTELTCYLGQKTFHRHQERQSFTWHIAFCIYFVMIVHKPIYRIHVIQISRP